MHAIVPQIAIAIGLLTSNREEGDERIVQWTWCPCWVPSLGVIVVCYGWGGE